jgi:hypothetical protein
MNTVRLIISCLLLCISCGQEKEVTYTQEELNNLLDDKSVGAYFWDEFKDYEAYYNLTPDESKVLGRWIALGNMSVPSYNSYTFFPNKLFILNFNYETYHVSDSDETYFEKALGTWEVGRDVVTIKIYAIITRDYSLIDDRIAGKDLFFVEPYEIKVIDINDVDLIGYTRRPINADILSGELQRMVEIKEPNRTENFLMRIIYVTDYITSTGKPEKNYRYFSIVPELARENLSGPDIVTNPEHIRKYIFGLWP